MITENNKHRVNKLLNMFNNHEIEIDDIEVFLAISRTNIVAKYLEMQGATFAEVFNEYEAKVAQTLIDSLGEINEISKRMGVEIPATEVLYILVDAMHEAIRRKAELSNDTDGTKEAMNISNTNSFAEELNRLFR